jgi:hypothetical protein
LNAGDVVRIIKNRLTFQKGYKTKWSSEIFMITDVLLTNPTTYKMKDQQDNEIIGSFYDKELQRINIEDTFLVEKVLQKKMCGGHTEYLVKWVGYPKKIQLLGYGC